MSATLPFGCSSAVVSPPILEKYTSMLFQIQQSFALSMLWSHYYLSLRSHIRGYKTTRDTMHDSSARGRIGGTLVRERERSRGQGN
jgi:hypothetical protein